MGESRHRRNARVRSASMVMAALGVLFASTVAAQSKQPVLRQTWALPQSPSGAAGFGNAVDSAGDVDGDGYDDVIIGEREGAHVYRGSATGLKQTPSWSVRKNGQTYFGESVAGVGDVNNDGYDDVVVGDMGKITGMSGGLHYRDGRVYLYLGSKNGLSSKADWVKDGSPSHFGGEVAAAGDVNNDGFDDLLVASAPVDVLNYCVTLHRNQVFLYRGTATGLEKAASWSVREPKNQNYACFGAKISAAGDIDGDGYDDVVVGAGHYLLQDQQPNGPNPKALQRGKVFVYNGSSSGLTATPTWTQTHPLNNATRTVHAFGDYLAGAGDINRDGFDDLVIHGDGEFREPDTESDWRFVYPGSSSGLPASYSQALDRSLSFSTGEAVTEFAGDIDNDGYDDILLHHDGDLTMHHGSNSGIVDAVARRVSAPKVSVGRHMAGAGDVNGDGYADVITQKALATTGGVVLFRGGPNPAPTAKPRTVIVDRGHDRTLTLKGTDLHNDPLSFSVTSQPDHGSVFGRTSTGRSSAEVTVRPPGNPPAGTTFDFEVSDPYGNTDTATVDVTFQQPPEFVPPTPSSDLEVDVGDRVTFTILATDPDTADLSYGVEPLPDGASFNGQSGSFGWTTTAAQIGEHDLELTASDGAATISRQITVTVDGSAGDTGVADVGDASDGGMLDADIGDSDIVDEADSSPADTNSMVEPDSSSVDVIDDDASEVDGDAEVARPSMGDEGCRCSTTHPGPFLGWWALAFGGLVVWRRPQS